MVAGNRLHAQRPRRLRRPVLQSLFAAGSIGGVLLAIGGTIFGLGRAFVNVPINTLFALLTPLDKRGRVNGVVNSAVNVSSLLGPAAAGPLAAAVGSSVGLGSIGVFTLVVVGVCLFLPGYRELNRTDRLLKQGPPPGTTESAPTATPPEGQDG